MLSCQRCGLEVILMLYDKASKHVKIESNICAPAYKAK